MIAKFILPWYGGSSAVWTTCLLFFQTGLLIGYGYSHLIVKWFTIKSQVKIHMVLLILSLISIPVLPKEWMKPDGTENPVLGILLLLTLTVGFPYIMVSTTGPLLQSWFAKSNPKKSPYRLYALSNLGSLLGLLTYPLFVETYMSLGVQSWYWTAGYLVFIIFCGLTAKGVWKLKPVIKKDENKVIKPVSKEIKLLWLLLAFLGTLTLLSITNKLTQDTVVIPFLWILPLSLYLITFIITFEKPKWYNRKFFIPLMLFSIALVLITQVRSTAPDVPLSITALIVQYCLAVFAICMTLHGELARLKPSENNLTLFYFFIAIGGVLAGIFINIFVPIIFTNYWELFLVFICSVSIVAYILWKSRELIKVSRTVIALSTLVAMSGIGFAISKEYRHINNNILDSTRNFYGVLRVYEENKGTGNWQRSLMHCNVIHGVELMDSAASYIPFAYYGSETGIGLALAHFPNRFDSAFQGMKVGMIGLGIGTVSTYGSEKDYFKYYEIDPEVEVLARKYFKHMSNFKGKTEVITGDGRISLENEMKESGSNNFDILAVDAFSGDLIPAHLLTHEAVELYLKNLKPNGILAFHITNNYIDLIPVLGGISEKFKRPMYYFIKQADASNPIASLWVLFTSNKTFLNNPAVSKFYSMYDVSVNPIVHWTDDHSPVLELLKSE